MLKSTAKRLLPSWVWSKLRLLRHWWAVANFHPRIVQHTYGGVRLTVELVDPLGAGWYDSDMPSVPEVELLKTGQLRPGSVVFNLGAHQAVVALVLAEMVGPSGKVIAVEGSGDCVKAAHRNRELNRADNLIIRHAAVAEHSGTVRFDLEGVSAVGTTVPAVSIDDLAAAYGVPDVIYMDIEGYEVHALRGASNTLKRCPDCMVEVHVGCGLESNGHSAADVLSFFPEDRYRRFIRTEAEQTMRPLTTIPGERFFVVAIAKSN